MEFLLYMSLGVFIAFYCFLFFRHRRAVKDSFSDFSWDDQNPKLTQEQESLHGDTVKACAEMAEKYISICEQQNLGYRNVPDAIRSLVTKEKPAQTSGD